MKIGVLGTGMVGATIATKLITLGNEVKLGSRNPGSEKAVAWAQANGAKASQGSYAEGSPLRRDSLQLHSRNSFN